MEVSRQQNKELRQYGDEREEDAQVHAGAHVEGYGTEAACQKTWHMGGRGEGLLCGHGSEDVLCVAGAGKTGEEAGLEVGQVP